MKIIDEAGLRPIKLWTEGVQLEVEALEQIKNTATLPFVHGVAVMPDAHRGMGSTVGTVVATVRAIVPACVGVDLACGMNYSQLVLKAYELPTGNEWVKKIHELLNKYIPNGRTNEGGPGDRGAWHNPPEIVQNTWRTHLEKEFQWIIEKYPKIIGRGLNHVNHLGTLGTGNHFVEIVTDENDNIGILLHSGSRGIGNAIARFFIERAKEDMVRQGIKLADVDLAYFTEDSAFFQDYIRAILWAQEYARWNRWVMMVHAKRAVAESLNLSEVDSGATIVSCHHNYVSIETHFDQKMYITRKGAVSAKEGKLGIIPGNMGQRSYIVRGKGNLDSYQSCSHGAGRSMSRTEAKRRFTVEDLIRTTEGVECLKDETVLDEIPLAYKDLDAVMEAQKDLVDIVHTLKQKVCMKGPEDPHSRKNKKKNKST